MTLKDVVKWKTRMSVVYAAGVWAVIGSYLHTVIINTSTLTSDFVPYTTRIYNFIKSFSGDSGSGDDAK
uniref:Uncharacterized protein n=1 Tax=Sparus aurata TaxID=8175 RepID=A0A671ULF6_SPAAU